MSELDWVTWVLETTGATRLLESSLLQNLWGGYGELRRLQLEGAPFPTAILKRVNAPPTMAASFSDLRKRRSYDVERAWYDDLSTLCNSDCRVAKCYAVQKSLLLLEDLGGAGYFPSRPPTPAQVRGGLNWLAHFHSRFLDRRPAVLWEQGSYWHLNTRPEEFERMSPGILRDSAQALDERLKAATYQTLLHGDAKPANFCWNSEGHAAAVDFQYVGPGCGIRDVAYFLDSCLGESGCSQQAEGWLDFYFARLGEALAQDHPARAAGDLEKEWRSLFAVAWADFCRFEQGWGRPGPLGSYSRKQLRKALEG